VARVVVVGAGVGGLAVSARLASDGHEVTLCESAPTVGGKLGTASEQGFTWDTGPSLLTWPQVLTDTLDAIGAPPLPTTRLDPAFTHRFADGRTLVVPDGPLDRVVAAISDQLGPAAGAEWAALSAYAARVFDVVEQPFLRRPLTPLQLLAQSTRLPALATVAPWRSLRQVGERHLHDPRLRQVLDRYATYTGSDPRRVPAPLVTVPHVEQAFGAHHVPGGLRRISDALQARAEELGVAVRTEARVARVEVADGAVRAVLLAGGQRLPADVVVSAVDARSTVALLPRRHSTALRARLHRATPSLSGFVLLLGVRGVPTLDGRPLGHHTVLYPAGYDDEFDSVFGTRRRPPRPIPDPAVYLTCPDDPTTRPDDDHRAVFVLVNAARHDPARGVDWDAPGLARRYGDAVLGVARQRGVDLGEVVVRRVRTPADLERDTGAPGGSIYGTSSHGPVAAFLRAPNRTGVRGLYCVGGSAHPGGGLPLVLSSAAIVHGLVRDAATLP
jgi:phytoene desaturase